MKDLNFFEPYIEKKEFKLNKKLLLAAVGILIVLIFLMNSVLNYIYIQQDEKTISRLKEVAENEQTLKKVAEIKEKEVEVSEFRESVEKIVLLDESLKEKDIITAELLNSITNQIPSEIFFTSISIGQSEIQLVGISDDEWSIAQFQKGLEGIEKIGDTFVSNISNQGIHYAFNLNILIEDVISDGTVNEEEEG